MDNKKILAIILVLGLTLRLISAFIVPIFEKPDEDRHFGYITFVSENKKLPIQTELHRSEFYQPPLYYVLSSFALSLAKSFTKDLFYLVFFMRVLSVIVSMITLYLIYKTSSLIFSDRKLVLGIVAFPALLPSYININSTVTNANFADFLSTFIIYQGISLLKERETYRNMLLFGVSVGISLITRLSILPAILTVPFIFAIKHHPRIKRAIKPVAIIVVTSLIISSWNFIRNFSLYGDFLGTNAMLLDFPYEGNLITAPFLGRLFGWTFITFWASFGRTNGVFIGNLNSTAGIFIFTISYLLLLAISLAALYGLYLFFKNNIKSRNTSNKIQKKSFAILFIHLLIMGLFFLRFNVWDFQPQGRLFFPTIFAISIFFTLGAYTITKKIHKWKFLRVYIISLIILNIASIISILNYFAKK